jgi:hypothetical protein
VADALQKQGHEISASIVKRLLPTLGHSRQSNRKADEGSKGQKLISRAPDFGLQLLGEIASGRRDQKSFELSFQLSLFPCKG